MLRAHTWVHPLTLRFGKVYTPLMNADKTNHMFTFLLAKRSLSYTGASNWVAWIAKAEASCVWVTRKSWVWMFESHGSNLPSLSNRRILENENISQHRKTGGNGKNVEKKRNSVKLQIESKQSIWVWEKKFFFSECLFFNQKYIYT